MKARAAVLAAALALVARGAAAQDIEALVRAYKGATSWDAREQMLRQIVQSRAAVPPEFYPDALREAMALREARLAAREEAARGQVKLEIVHQLGLLRASGSVPEVYKLFVEEKDYSLRGACLEALGRMGAREHEGAMTDVLSRVSTTPEGGGAGEVMALGAIAGLEALADPAGYAAVFYASFGRSPAVVRKRASEALGTIAPDPTDVLQEIVARDPTLMVRLEAINVQVGSRASTEKKIDTALAALTDLAGRRLESTQDRTVATRIRGVAVQALIDNKAHGDNALPLLDGLSRDEPDVNVRLAAVYAMGVVGTDKAAEMLTESLKALNDRQEAGGQIDERFVRTTIRAAGLAGKRVARQELFRVKFAGYASGVVREAERALEQIP